MVVGRLGRVPYIDNALFRRSRERGSSKHVYPKDHHRFGGRTWGVEFVRSQSFTKSNIDTAFHIA